MCNFWHDLKLAEGGQCLVEVEVFRGDIMQGFAENVSVLQGTPMLEVRYTVMFLFRCHFGNYSITFAPVSTMKTWHNVFFFFLEIATMNGTIAVAITIFYEYICTSMTILNKLIKIVLLFRIPCCIDGHPTSYLDTPNICESKEYPSITLEMYRHYLGVKVRRVDLQ